MIGIRKMSFKALVDNVASSQHSPMLRLRLSSRQTEFSEVSALRIREATLSNYIMEGFGSDCLAGVQ